MKVAAQSIALGEPQHHLRTSFVLWAATRAATGRGRRRGRLLQPVLQATVDGVGDDGREHCDPVPVTSPDLCRSLSELPRYRLRHRAAKPGCTFRYARDVVVAENPAMDLFVLQ